MTYLHHFQKLIHSRVFAAVLFCFFGIGYLWKADYGKLSFERPGSIHQWRQCDGPSLALTYYQDGNALWEPAMHNQLNGKGKAGGEFPILYYAAAKLYHLFGPQEFILRFIHLGIFLLGLIVLFYAFLIVCPIPILTPLPFVLFWSSPTLLFYTNNFLPDGPGLGFALLGMGLIWISISLSKDWLFYLGCVAFAFAALVKVSMIIPFIGFLFVGFTSSFWSTNKGASFLRFSKLKLLVGAALVFLPSLVWYSHIRSYNDENGGIYFSTAIKPVWESTWFEVVATYHAIENGWIELLWPPLTMIITVMACLTFLVIGLKNWRKASWVLVFITLFGSFQFALVFFTPLVDHDYYYLAFMPALLMALIYVIHELSTWLKSRVQARSLLFLVAAVPLLMMLSFGASASLFHNSYLHWYDMYTFNKNLNNLEPWLNEQGVTYDSKVICLPDPSSNQSLYLMNRKGWTALTGIYTTDDVDSLIKQGAEYAIITDTSFYSFTYMQYHITDTIGYHGDIGVYKIEKSRWADF